MKMKKNNTKINIENLIEALAAYLDDDYSESNVYRINLDMLSNEEIEALLNVEHDRFEFDIEPGLYIEMTKK